MLEKCLSFERCEEDTVLTEIKQILKKLRQNIFILFVSSDPTIFPERKWQQVRFL
jgi:hypothetical protein